MIEQLRLRGVAGSVLWGYRTVADLGGWAIVRMAAPVPRARDGVKRKPGAHGWQLQALVRQADAFALRQRPLYFTAPRRGGFWCWPFLEAPRVEGGILRATLGSPEQ